MAYYEIRSAEGVLHAAAVSREAAEERAQSLRARLDEDFTLTEVTDHAGGFRYEVLVQGKWYDNAVIFATAEEAQHAADIKLWAWSQAEDVRVVEDPRLPNYRVEDGVVSHIPGTP